MDKELCGCLEETHGYKSKNINICDYKRVCTAQKLMVWQGLSSVGCCVSNLHWEVSEHQSLQGQTLVEKLLGTRVAGSTLDGPRSG